MSNKLHPHRFSFVVCLASVLVALFLFLGAIGVAQFVDIARGKDLSCETVPLAETCEIGAFVGVNPPSKAAVNEFESLAGRHIHSAVWYQGWDASNQPPFPTSELSGARYHDGYDTHTILHLTWEPWVDLESIANGAYDTYLTSYANEAKSWGETIRLRFAHEMIQDNVYDNCQGQPNCPEWYPWQDQPITYTLAFRHTHDVFEATGATNVEFVWCPNNYPFDFNFSFR
jgi:hypothetical protein